MYKNTFRAGIAPTSFPWDIISQRRKNVYRTKLLLYNRNKIVTVHGALHHAARHPAGKIAVACIQPLAVRRLFNGLDALQFAAGWAVNCNIKSDSGVFFWIPRGIRRF